MTKFKKNQRVVYIGETTKDLVFGKTYKVNSYSGLTTTNLYVAGILTSSPAINFLAANNKSFSTLLKKITPVSAVNVYEKPADLQPGSLYLVRRRSGYTVARFKKPVDSEYSVFTIHKGKPFLVRVDNIRIAPKDRVDNYLKQATV